MKKQLFAVLMALMLATTGVAIAQNYQSAPSATNETEPVNGPDVDVDTGSRAEGAVDVDVSRHGDADTSATGIDEGGSLGDEDTTTTGAAGDMDNDLPATASALPSVALLGLLALAGAFAVRFLR